MTFKHLQFGQIVISWYHKIAGDNNCFSFNLVYQKGRFRYKIEKVNTTIEFCILELVFVPNFSLNWQFRFFEPSLPKRVFPVKNRRSEHRNWILHIQISQGIQFQLTLTVSFIFFYQICPKRVFPVENGEVALARASMVVTYYIKLFRAEVGRHNGILMSLFLLVAGIKMDQLRDS